MSKHLINRSVFVEYYVALVVFIFFISIYYFFFEYADRILSQKVLTWFDERLMIITIMMAGIFLILFFYLMYRSRQFMMYLEITPERLKVIEQKKEMILSQTEISRQAIKDIQLKIRERLNQYTGKTNYYVDLFIYTSDLQKKLSLPGENSLKIMDELTIMQYPIIEKSKDYQEQIQTIIYKEKSDRAIAQWALIPVVIGSLFILSLVIFLLYFFRNYWI